MAIDAPPTVETVVVRPIRLPEPAGDPAFSIIRLDHRDLQASPRLDESLSAVPSFSLFRRTSSLQANPTTQGASLRAIAGSGASRALVTLDGVPQNDPFGGWVIWSSLPSDTIGAATVVRGAGAGPYGAGALTGAIDLAEQQTAPGGAAADVSAGNLGDVQGQAITSARFGPASLFVSAAGERADGYIPVRDPQRGAADRPLTLHDWSASARLTVDVGPGVLAARVAAYQEDRGAGLAGAGSRAQGQQASLSYAREPTADALGYRLQGWVTRSDLLNTSVSVASGRGSTTPANDQYATPATGFGLNGAVRRAGRDYSLEVGADVRFDEGASHELYRYMSGAFTRRRVTGGEALVGGIYVEGSRDFSPWLITGGARVDGWGDLDSHRIERNAQTGAVTLNQHTSNRGGVQPTARVGLRRNFDYGLFVRTAAYAGFRPATLNELNRPFRVGNDVTEANPALKPERLYGAEVAIGDDGARGAWSLTSFANQVDDAIINATVRKGPFTDPVAGFIPSGGTLFKRRNVSRIEAFGLEADAHRAVTDTLNARIAADYTDAKVVGGAAAPELTGRRPAETPKFAATAGIDWTAMERLVLSADARYESARYDDDLNTRRLAPGVTFDARAEVRITPQLSAYVAADNLFDAAIQTGRTADNVVSYDAPRTIRFGLRLRGR